MVVRAISEEFVFIGVQKFDFGEFVYCPHYFDESVRSQEVIVVKES